MDKKINIDDLMPMYYPDSINEGFRPDARGASRLRGGNVLKQLGSRLQEGEKQNRVSSHAPKVFSLKDY
jgi:hypothetical protein